MYSNRFRRIKSVNFVVLLVRALCKGFPRFHTGKAVRTATPYNYNLSGECRGGPHPPPPPLIFRPNWGPKGRKKIFSRLGIPLSPGSGWPPPPPHPLSECLACLDPPLNPVEDQPTRWSFLPEPGEDMDIPLGLLQGGVIRIVKQLQKFQLNRNVFPQIIIVNVI